MLPRSKTLRSAEFTEVVLQGSVVRSSSFLMRVKKTGIATSRFSVAVSKKVAKTAVQRNSIRRKAYAALEKLFPQIGPGFEGVILTNNKIIDMTTNAIFGELADTFKAASLI